MVTETIMQVCSDILISALNGVSTLNLPTALIAILADYTAYGVWILGADLCLAVMSCVMFWIGVKLTLGVVIFIWRLLPFT